MCRIGSGTKLVSRSSTDHASETWTLLQRNNASLQLTFRRLSRSWDVTLRRRFLVDNGGKRIRCEPRFRAGNAHHQLEDAQILNVPCWGVIFYQTTRSVLQPLGSNGTIQSLLTFSTFSSKLLAISFNHSNPAYKFKFWWTKPRNDWAGNFCTTWSFLFQFTFPITNGALSNLGICNLVLAWKWEGCNSMDGL